MKDMTIKIVTGKIKLRQLLITRCDNKMVLLRNLKYDFKCDYYNSQASNHSSFYFLL